MIRSNPTLARLEDPGEIDDLVREIQDADAARSEWVTNQKLLTEQRFGIGAGKKTFPWPGASDIRIPTQDKAIRRWKPKILSLVYDAQPVAYFRALDPSDVEAARSVEQFYDWLFRTRMESTLEEICYLADSIAHRGFGLLQVAWDYRVEDETRVLEVADFWPDGVGDISDDEIARVLVAEYEIDPGPQLEEMISEIRSGAEKLSFTYRTKVKDCPRIISRDPLDVIVPVGATCVEDAEWICVRQIMTPRQLRALAQSGFFEASRVESALEGARTAQRSPLEQSLAKAEGVYTEASTLKEIEVWEVYHWDTEKQRRRVVTWLEATSRAVLSSRPYSFPFHRWPFVKFDHEKTARRWYSSRGISRMLSPIARSINRLHNSRLDAIAIQLAPCFKYRSLSGVIPRAFEFAPGKMLPVSDLQDLEPLQHDLRNIPLYTQEEYQARQYAEDYAGIYDSSLMNPLRPTERRTATEVAYVADQVQGAFSLDAKLFQRAMGQVHQMVWQLWYEFGEEAVYYRVLNEEQPRLFKKSEVARDYDIVPAGTPASTNKALELARAREALQFFAADQSGVIDKAELFRWYLGLLDWALAKRVIRGPEELQAQQILMRAANEIASGNLQAILGEAAAAGQALVRGAAMPAAPPIS